MIPRSLFAIHWIDRKRGGEGMLWRDRDTGACWLSEIACEDYLMAHHLRTEQECEIVEWRRAEVKP